ncbi:MAG TPA: sigma-54 dependent transcriptional regulator, partial [Polyangiaceae bacterium]|nr:sigma-54 dependent transcriptional regulator [Polyangiaceae bacterium]
LSRLLAAHGISVKTADDGAMAMEVLSEESFDVALVDLMMPRVGGLEVLAHVRERHAATQVILMTAFGDVETAVQAVRAGAHHFLTKPFRSNDEVVLAVMKAAEHRRLVDHAVMLERRLEQMQKFGGLIGNSPKMQEVYRLALGVATTASTVLILGESGTGKELTARAIHQHSARSEKAFVPVNCSAIPVDLVESELFGHVKGAFTGATTSRPGLFEVADGGTLFLDEVGDLPPLAQVKLLRALQEAEIKRVGSNETKTVDVRVIAATNVDLKTRIGEGRFREDLYYRLNVVAIVLPSLRERPEDVPLLAQHFVQKYAERANRQIRGISMPALELLKSQHWQGNVRELENAIEHAIVFCAGENIEPKDLPQLTPPSPRTNGAISSTPAPASASDVGALGELPFPVAKAKALTAFESAYFQNVLDRAGGNVSEAARLSGLDRSNFRRAARRAGVKMRDDG